MIQITALFVNAYRELNSQKLFWVTLILSGLVAGVFAAIGLEDGKATFLWFNVPLPEQLFLPPPEMFFKLMILMLGVTFWLGWGATILGIIGTAGIFPNFIAGGSIDLVLSKPIGRFRLFLIKYLTGLLFMALQVTAFISVCFLVLRWRGGVWEPGLFLAVPLMVLFFSYLFAVCVLIGIITRSTVAALLLTMLFWLLVFGTNFADGIALNIRTTLDVEAERRQAQVERVKENNPEADITQMQYRVEDSIKNAETARKWERGIVMAKTFLPKTSETLGLLERELIKVADLPGAGAEDAGSAGGGFGNPRDQGEINRRVQETIRNRTTTWIIGTSLAFEAFLVGLAALIFCRRDFS